RGPAVYGAVCSRAFATAWRLAAGKAVAMGLDHFDLCPDCARGGVLSCGAETVTGADLRILPYVSTRSCGGLWRRGFSRRRRQFAAQQRQLRQATSAPRYRFNQKVIPFPQNFQICSRAWEFPLRCWLAAAEETALLLRGGGRRSCWMRVSRVARSSGA